MYLANDSPKTYRLTQFKLFPDAQQLGSLSALIH